MLFHPITDTFLKQPTAAQAILGEVNELREFSFPQSRLLCYSEVAPSALNLLEYCSPETEKNFFPHINDRIIDPGFI
jgi:hypothetical protein